MAWSKEHSKHGLILSPSHSVLTRELRVLDGKSYGVYPNHTVFVSKAIGLPAVLAALIASINKFIQILHKWLIVAK